MAARSKIVLWTFIGLAIIALLVFFLIPGLFASVAYPLPDNFRAPLANRAKQYGLSPNTLAALTYTESGFNLTSHSGAGAIGPTQFLPSTARAVAARLGVSPFSPDDLTKSPDLAEWFAAYYVSTDLKTYGNLHLALVAYNGGGGAAVASARGYGLPGPEAYANKIQRIQGAYDAIYGSWWNSGITTSPAPTPTASSSAPAAAATPSAQQFTVQPNSGLDILGSGSVLNIWQGLVSNPSTSTPSGNTSTSTPGDINNLWQALLPAS